MNALHDSPLSINAFLPLSRMAAVADSSRTLYANGKPFPHVVFDNFFDPAILDLVLSEFPILRMLPNTVLSLTTVHI